MEGKFAAIDLKKTMWQAWNETKARSSGMLQEYLDAGFDRRQWAYSLRLNPKLAAGFTSLVQFRAGTFWSGHRLTKAKLLHPECGESRCVVCGDEVEGGETMAHYVLECPMWAEPREEFLNDWISGAEDMLINFESQTRRLTQQRGYQRATEQPQAGRQVSVSEGEAGDGAINQETEASEGEQVDAESRRMTGEREMDEVERLLDEMERELNGEVEGEVEVEVEEVEEQEVEVEEEQVVEVEASIEISEREKKMVQLLVGSQLDDGTRLWKTPAPPQRSHVDAVAAAVGADTPVRIDVLLDRAETMMTAGGGVSWRIRTVLDVHETIPCQRVQCGVVVAVASFFRMTRAPRRRIVCAAIEDYKSSRRPVLDRGVGGIVRGMPRVREHMHTNAILMTGLAI